MATQLSSIRRRARNMRVASPRHPEQATSGPASRATGPAAAARLTVTTRSVIGQAIRLRRPCRFALACLGVGIRESLCLQFLADPATPLVIRADPSPSHLQESDRPTLATQPQLVATLGVLEGTRRAAEYSGKALQGVAEFGDAILGRPGGRRRCSSVHRLLLRAPHGPMPQDRGTPKIISATELALPDNGVAQRRRPRPARGTLGEAARDNECGSRTARGDLGESRGNAAPPGRKKAHGVSVGWFCNPLISGEILVRPAGFEPTTPWFVAKYSIQLSYGRSETRSIHASFGG